MGELLTRISVAYTDADNDRYTLERSIDVSGGEMTELYEQLRSRGAFTRAIVESAGDAIITTGETGVLTSFNPAAERLFGWTAAQACGRGMSTAADITAGPGPACRPGAGPAGS
jgi:two-component system, LuxR family, sensor kinase FixL